MGSVRFCGNGRRCSLFRRNPLACTDHRSAFEQTIDWRSAGASAADEQPAHVDGRFAGRPLRGDGECRLWHLRVAVRAVAGGSGYADRRADRFSRRAHAGARRSRRSTPGWRSAATEATSTPAWLRLPIPRATAKRRRAAALRSTASRTGKIAPERLIHLPLQQLASGRKTRLIGETESDKGVPYPAAIAVLGAAGREKLLVAENLSDDVVLVDAATGAIEKRFDLSESDAVPCDVSHCAGRDERRQARICGAVECIGDCGARSGARHGGAQAGAAQAVQPRCAGNASLRVRLSPDEKTLYVALANRDAVAAVNVGAGSSR